jgi:hypothetical protein
MGFVYADVKLTNAMDLIEVKRCTMGEEEVRSMYVNVMADTGCLMMAINENIQECLQLPVCGRQAVVLANGSRIECDLAGPVEVRFDNRVARCYAYVLPGDSEPLLGAIPMEEMDLIVHPLRRELIANPKHPEGIVLNLGRIRKLL